MTWLRELETLWQPYSRSSTPAAMLSSRLVHPGLPKNDRSNCSALLLGLTSLRSRPSFSGAFGIRLFCGRSLCRMPNDISPVLGCGKCENTFGLDCRIEQSDHMETGVVSDIDEPFCLPVSWLERTDGHSNSCKPLTRRKEADHWRVALEEITHEGHSYGCC